MVCDLVFRVAAPFPQTRRNRPRCGRLERTRFAKPARARRQRRGGDKPATGDRRPNRARARGRGTDLFVFRPVEAAEDVPAAGLPRRRNGYDAHHCEHRPSRNGEDAEQIGAVSRSHSRQRRAAAEARRFSSTCRSLPAMALLKSAGEVLLAHEEPQRNAAADGGPDRPASARPARGDVPQRSVFGRAGAAVLKPRSGRAGDSPSFRDSDSDWASYCRPAGPPSTGQLPRRRSPSAAASFTRRRAFAERCWWPVRRTTRDFSRP